MSDTGNLNPMLAASNTLFSVMAQFRDVDKQAKLRKQEFQQLISQGFEDFSENLTWQQVDNKDIDLAKYALASFVDEVVLLSSWQGKNEWMAQTLQWQYFGEHGAGEGFFSHLSELRQQGADKIDILEIYYLCLQLGFQGIYRIHDTEKLNPLKRELKLCIRRYRNITGVSLNTKSGILQMSVNERKRFPYLPTLAGIAVAMIILYSSLSFGLDKATLLTFCY